AEYPSEKDEEVAGKSFEEEREELKEEEKVEETQEEPKEVTSEDAPNIEQTPNDKKDE
ncbi:hypothetical protein H3291_28725, partial [Escherichia coli]|nr:hypothetical protein [Escherichia coli]